MLTNLKEHKTLRKLLVNLLEHKNKMKKLIKY